MKMFTEKKVWQKFLIALLTIVLLFQFMMPPKVYADDDDRGVIAGAIYDAFSELAENAIVGTAHLTASIGDIAMSAFNNFMLGTAGFGTAMLSQEALDYKDDNGNYSWFHLTNEEKSEITGNNGSSNVAVDEKDGKTVVYVYDDYLDNEIGITDSEWEIPNLLYSPENIFGNNIALLDVNFLNPNTYTPVVESGKGVNSAEESSESIGVSLKETISGWYKAFRNIAVVALLSILVYLGIRILISATAEDKAKYKEVLKDWTIALVLVFLMHFIMSAAIMVVNLANDLFREVNNNVYVSVSDGTVFKSNFTGVMRFLAQSKEPADAWAYTVVYIVLVIYTFTFTIQYLKRVLYIAFYTMISPLVAITYPMDKLGDGKSQAFNTWFKEYMMTMALQPIHLVIYTVVVSSALTLSIKSPIYAIVAIGFLIPAEQFIKSLFGIQSKADGGFGAFAGGALAMNAINRLRKPIGGPSSKGGNNRLSAGNESKEENTKIRQSSNKELSSWQRKQKEDDGFLSGGSNTEGENEELSGVNTTQADAALLGAGVGAGAAAAVMSGQGNGVSGNTSNQPDNRESEAQIRNANTGDRELNNEDNNAQDNSINAGVYVSPEQQYKYLRKMRRTGDSNDAKRVLKGFGKGALKGGRFIARTGLRAAGAGVLGTIGVAAGVASGKGISTALQYGGAGAYAGSVVGGNIANLSERGINKTIRGATTLKGSIQNGVQTYKANKTSDYKNAGMLDEVRERERQQARKSKQYDDLIKQYSMKTGNKYSGEEKKNLRERIYDYDQNRAITDPKKIMDALQLEDKYKDKYSHDNIADVMELTKQYDGSYFTDEKKSAQLNRALDARGLNDKNKNEVKSLLYEANYGSDGLSYTEFLTKQKAKQQPQQQIQQQQEQQAQPKTVKIHKINKKSKTNSSKGTTGLENPTQNNNSTGNN